MLSPTLPKPIEAELAKEEKQRSRANSSLSTSSAEKPVRTPVSSAPTSASKVREPVIAKVKDGTKEKDIIKPIRAAGPGSAARREAERLAEERRLALEKKEAAERKAEEEREREEAAEEERRLAEEQKPKSLIARLRYGRHHLSRVRKILYAPPQPGRYSVVKKAEAMTGAVKTPESRVDSKNGAVRTPDKRPRPAENDAPVSNKKQKTTGLDTLAVTKKHKGPAVLDLDKNPRTPVQAAIPSPSIHKSGGSVKTSTPSTAHLKSAAIIRSASGDTPVTTPGGKVPNSQGTPAATRRATGAKHPTSAPSTRAAELTSLTALGQHYNALGRKLKHENQAIAAKPKDELTEPERKRAALLGLECILAYMLAFALGDARRKLEGRSAEVETSWRTMLPMFRHMRGFAGKYRYLDGLHCWLGVAIYARIAGVAGERVARTKEAGSVESPADVSAPAGAGTGEGNAKMLADAWRGLAECAREGADKLSVEDVMGIFPATWKARRTGTREEKTENLLAGKGGDGVAKEADLKGGYWLPVGVDTTPVQAVRFGVGVIREWIRQQETGYEPRIRI